MRFILKLIVVFVLTLSFTFCETSFTDEPLHEKPEASFWSQGEEGLPINGVEISSDKTIKSHKYDNDNETMTSNKENFQAFTTTSSGMYTTRVAHQHTILPKNAAKILPGPKLNTKHTGISVELNVADAFNLSFVYKDDRCVEFGKCLKTGNLFCRCDQLCEVYGDCCLEYMGMRNTTPEVKPIFKCSSFSSDSIHPTWGVYVISTCPSKYNDVQVITRCRNETLQEAGPPVIDNNNRTDIYRNIFCAICNDVTNFAYLSVTYYPTQTYKGSMLSMLNMTTAELKTFVYDLSYQIHIPRNFTPRYCLKQLITNDDATCKMYINPVFHKNNPNELYRNSFCTSNTDKKRKTETCFGKVVNFFPKPKSNDVRSHLMSILFSFSSMDKQRDEKCGEWSPETRNIRVCNQLPLFSNSPFKIQYRVEVHRNTTEKELIQVGLISILMKNALNSIAITGNVKMYVNKEGTALKIESTGTILKTAFSHEIRDMLQSLTNQNAVLTISGKGKSVYTIGKLTPQSIESTSNSSIFFATKPLAVYNIQRYLQNYDVHSEIPNFPKVCSKVEITGKRIGNDTLVVDSFDCKEIKQRNSDLTALSILTYSLCSCSISALILMIVVNRKRRLHLEIPFSNLENMSVAMGFGNFLIMIRGEVALLTGSSWICQAISLVLHYVFLGVFSFGNVAVFYMVTTLFKLTARPCAHDGRLAKKRICMTFIGLLIPFLIVVSGFVVDRFGPPYFSPGYRSNDCFPTQFPGNFIFFTGPIIVSILINIICLLYIMVKIHITKFPKKTTQGLTILTEVKVFFRLSAMTGLSWVTGIVASYLQSDWLEYVFTILCGSQGLLIAAANMSTRRQRRDTTLQEADGIMMKHSK